MTNTRLQNVTRKALFLLMMVLLGSTSLLRADELTVYDGTTTNSYVPIYGFYADSYLRCQYVIPATDLAEMDGSTIYYLKNYLSSPSAAALTGTFQVYLAEVADATISAFYDGEVTVVYEGTVNTTEEIMTIEFTDGYTYGGGNLLIGFDLITPGNYKSCVFFGETVADASVQGYNYSSVSAISPTQCNFIPKTTFVYEASDVTRYQVSAYSNPENAGVITGAGKYNEDSECTLTATPSDAAYYFINWTDEAGEVVSTDAAYTFTVTRDVTYVANFGLSELYTVTLSTNPANAGFIFSGEGQFYENSTTSLIAMSTDDYLFVNWTRDGEVFATSPYYQTVVTEDLDLVANFVQYDGMTYYDGSITNQWTPVWLSNAGNYLQSQFVMPAEDLTDMVGKSIKGLKFYVDSDETYMNFSEFRVYMTEHPTETINDFIDMNTAVTVYDGVLSMRNNEMIISFNTPYDYYGGNLLIGINNLAPTGSHYVEFYGVDKRDASISNSRYNNEFNNFYPMQTNFLPKTTFFIDEDLAPRYNITAVVNPEEAGFVEGTGEYSEGFNCTLTAVKNHGYTFVNWTLNDEVVSTDPTYTFAVTGDAEYVANFEESGSEEIELTIHDGGITNYYVPMYVMYFDEWTKSQFVIPAEDLQEIANYTINAIKFYTNGSNIPYTTESPIVMYMTEVEYTEINSYINIEDAETVYTGYVEFYATEQGGEAILTFDTPFAYNGGNLLIGCENTSNVNWKSIYFYGETVYGASISGSNGSSPASVQASQRNFLPKTTFYAELNLAPAKLVINPDPMDMGYRPIGAWMKPAGLTLSNEGGPTVISDIYFDNDYFQMNEVTVPFRMAAGGVLDLIINHGEAEEGQVNANMVVNYGDNKTTMFPISAYAYAPVMGDVWENPIEITVPYAATAPTGIRYNYDIPGGTPGANDAVYKLEVEQLSLLEVSTGAAASAIAVYTEEGFDGVGGPDLDNTYSYSVTSETSFVGDWYYYDNGINEDAIGIGGGNFWWGVMFPAGSYSGNLVSSVATYDYAAMTGTVTIFNDGETAPAMPVATADIVLTGSGEFVEVVFDEPATINPAKNVWVVLYNASGTTYPAAVCTNTGDANGRWVSLDGSSWDDLAGFGLDYTFMLRAYIGMGGRGTVTEISVPQPEVVNTGVFANAGTSYRPQHDLLRDGTEVAVEPGTYYVVVSSAEEEFPVNISLSDVPAPVAAQVIYPSVDATDVTEPCTFMWTLGDYTQEMQVLYGTQYPPTSALIDWTDSLVGSVEVNELKHNIVYFMQVNERNYSGTTVGEIIPFITHLDAPTLYTDLPYYAYEGDDIRIYWDAIESESLLYYNVYLNDSLISVTEETEFVQSDVTYNLTTGYSFQVTAVYDLGESERSDEMFFLVSGNGNVTGHVYEQDGVTPIADVDVTFYGEDVFGVWKWQEVLTDEEGAYNVSLPYGSFSGYAWKEEYQEANVDQINIYYNDTIEGVDFMLTEELVPVAEVVAEEVDANAEITWTLNEGGRSLQYYRVYRKNAGNNSNAELIADSLLTTSYVDTGWSDLAYDDYMYGVSALYQGNHETNRDGGFVYGFENDLEGWTNIIVNTDGGDWIHNSENHGGYDYTGLAHTGTGFAMCYSYVDNQGAYNTDAYLVSPQKYTIAENSTMTFWADNANDSYPEDFSVCVSTAVEPTANDFVEIWNGGAKGTNNEGAIVRHTNNRYQNWREHVVDLSAFAGQTVWIAFHDVNYDMYEIWIDDVVVYGVENDPLPAGFTESPITWSNVLSKKMVSDLYVSPTGYAMWDGAGFNTISNSPDSFYEDFELGMPEGWTTIDADGDGFDWVSSYEPGQYHHSTVSLLGSGHNGSDAYVLSGSYANAISMALTPDNYLVTPMVTIKNGSTFSFWACSQDQYYAAEHFGVAVSIDGETFEMLDEWTISAKGGAPADKPKERGGEKGQTTWINYQVDLSAYAGKQANIAIRHFNCYDMFILNVDDVELYVNQGRQHIGYNVVVTDVEGEEVANLETEEVQIQLPVEDLVEGETYYCKVANIYSSGTTDYIETSFVYIPCDNYEGCVYAITDHTDEGNLIVWDKPTFDGESGWMYYDRSLNGSRGALCGYDLSFYDGWYWGVMFPAGTYSGDILTKIQLYQMFDMDYAMAYIYNGGDDAPENMVASIDDIQFVAEGRWIDYELETPVAIDTEENVWVILYCPDPSQYGASMCVYNEGENSAWISSDGVTWVDYNSEYSFKIRAFFDQYKPMGTLIYRNDELLGINPGTEYLDEEGTEEDVYTIRLVYPDYAMSCEQEVVVTPRHNITAVPSSDAYGIAEGSGVYFEGVECTLTAVAFDNAVFADWIKDGEVVSTDAEYTFTVEDDAEYVAHFVYTGNNWGVDPSLYENSMTVTGIIMIDGEEQANDFLEIGAFVGEECRGAARLAYYPQVDRYLAYLTIYGDASEALTFMLYSHYDEAVVDLMCTNEMNFVADEALGTPFEPYEFNFMNVIAVDYQFTPGWNWWSTHVDLTAIDGLAMLEEGVGESAIMISSQTQFTNYYAGYGWYGSLSTINNEEMYRVQMDGEAEFTMVGPKANPADHPITLTKGWNHIGYISATEMSVNDALSNINAQQGDMVKSQKSYANYYQGYGWYGSLNTIKPGDGLMFKSMSDNPMTFTYPVATGSKELAENLTGENNHWVPNVYAYQSNMTVMAVVEMEGIELASDNYELAAFVNGECRGSIELMYAEPLNRFVAFLTVSGEEVANMYFGLYNKETGEEFFNTNTSLTFNADAMVGDPDEPFVIGFRDSSAINELGNAMKIYPNPVSIGEKVNVLISNSMRPVRIEIVDAIGKIVSVESSTNWPASIAVPASAGVYTVRIITEDNGVMIQKMVVK